MEEPAKKKKSEMLTSKTGGAYIPPAKLKLMQASITDKSSAAYQRIAWEALKKSIHGLINKVNTSNISIIVRELFRENIVRGRGLLCKSIIQAQALSPKFTHVYAALVSIINSKFPNIGELLLRRLILQFKRGFKRNDKSICISSTTFIAHLVNQRVAHEILALEILTLLIESPTDDSIEVAIAFLKECGMKLLEVSSKGIDAIFTMLRNILHEGKVEKRVQYMIEVLFQIRKIKFKDNEAVIEELDVVEEEDQFTHLIMLDDVVNGEDIINVFQFDAEYQEHEEKYKTLKKEILGESDESGGESSGGDASSEEESQDEEDEEKKQLILDNTESNLIALRRTIYLTINSSLDYEECAHKLMKMQLKPGQEAELCNMFLDCCGELRTYEKFYGLLAQRFCEINKIYIPPLQDMFKASYETVHRLETNKLRNVAKFFAHLLFTDAISWEVMACIKLSFEDTSSSSRIFIKILFQELSEYMGLVNLNERLKDPTLQEAFAGLFPRDNPKNTRFAINFFTSIGLGGLTDDLREHLKNQPKPSLDAVQVEEESSSSDDSSSSTINILSDSDSDSSDESSSSEDSEDSSKKKKKKKKDKSKKEKSKSRARGRSVSVEKKSKKNKKSKKQKPKDVEVAKKKNNREARFIEKQEMTKQHKHKERESDDIPRENRQYERNKPSYESSRNTRHNEEQSSRKRRNSEESSESESDSEPQQHSKQVKSEIRFGNRNKELLEKYENEVNKRKRTLEEEDSRSEEERRKQSSKHGRYELTSRRQKPDEEDSDSDEKEIPKQKKERHTKHKKINEENLKKQIKEERDSDSDDNQPIEKSRRKNEKEQTRRYDKDEVSRKQRNVKDTFKYEKESKRGKVEEVSDSDEKQRNRNSRRKEKESSLKIRDKNTDRLKKYEEDSDSTEKQTKYSKYRERNIGKPNPRVEKSKKGKNLEVDSDSDEKHQRDSLKHKRRDTHKHKARDESTGGNEESKRKYNKEKDEQRSKHKTSKNKKEESTESDSSSESETETRVVRKTDRNDQKRKFASKIEKEESVERKRKSVKYEETQTSFKRRREEEYEESRRRRVFRDERYRRT